MEIEKQTFRLPGQGVQLAAFLSVNNKMHVVVFRWVKACLLSIDMSILSSSDSVTWVT